MFDIETIRAISIALLAAIVGGVAWQTIGVSRRSRRIERADNPSQSGTDQIRLLTVLRDLLLLLGLLLVASVIVSPPLLLNGRGAAHFPFDTLVQILGLFSIGTGSLLGAWAFRSLGEFAVEKIQVAKDHRLVQTGPYAYSRHPMYGSTLLIGIGLFLLYLNVVFLILTLIVFGINIRRAQAEEKLLSSPQAFGTRYEEYRRRTRRFVPRLL